MASGLGLINYRVIDISANGELVGLLDEAGHNHVVRPDLPTLALHDELMGAVAHPGVQLLMSRGAQQFHRVTMEYVNCAQIVMLNRMHPEATADWLRA